MSNIPVIIMDPSTGHKNTSSSVSVLLNIAGVDANLHKNNRNPTLLIIRSHKINYSSSLNDIMYLNLVFKKRNN